jgi:hypothetical protein
VKLTVATILLVPLLGPSAVRADDGAPGCCLCSCIIGGEGLDRCFDVTGGGDCDAGCVVEAATSSDGRDMCQSMVQSNVECAAIPSCAIAPESAAAPLFSLAGIVGVIALLCGLGWINVRDRMS